MIEHLRHVVRWGLGLGLIVAGVGHFVVHDEFLGQVPGWMPVPSLVVWVTGVMEIALGLAVLAWRDRRREVGWAIAAFLVAVFPGNVHQALAGTDAFGLDTPAARWTRLVFQPPLILLALWSTGALTRWRRPAPSG